VPAESRRRCAQQALAGTLDIDGTNIAGLLNELEAEKLIERRRSPEDRRRHLVELTDIGAEQLAMSEYARQRSRKRCSARSMRVGARRSTACFSRRPPARW
jgi:DNA-binding MarR family transcriptional regulator